VNILFRADADVLKPLVPAPLKADPDQPLVLYVGHFEFADFDLPYNEAGLLVPVVREGEPARAFAVVLYLDRANPIVGGREIYGWPKKDAEEVLFRDDGASVRAEVTRYGKKIITVTLEVERASAGLVK
jgi:acetoacetate decarboxylase